MKLSRKVHPYLIIILSFLGVVAIGTILLVMPFAQKNMQSMGFFDALFMATSAVCVTGLGTRSPVDFTWYGRVVMAILMEIGGLSFITIAVFFFSILGGKIGVSNGFLLKEALNQNSLSGIVSLVKKIVIISFSVQLVGAIIDFFPLMKYYDNHWEAFAVSLFHSAASFNNAGFDVFGYESMICFKDNLILNFTTMGMITIGSIGFVVIDDLFTHGFRWKKFTLHTKLTLITTVALIFGGTLFLKICIIDNKDMSWLQALFTSITCRTAGFTTYDMANLSGNPGAFITVIALMLIGASPCSTGGGVKTTTFAIVIIAIYYFAKGKKSRAFHRRIADDQIFKALSLMVIAIVIVSVGTILVGLVNPEITNFADSNGKPFGVEHVLFEMASAFSTTGLTMGLCGSGALNVWSKLIFCVVMLFGRLGPLTVIGLVNKNWGTDSSEDVTYIEESVIIG